MESVGTTDIGAVRGRASLTNANRLVSVSGTAGTATESHIEDGVSGNYKFSFAVTLTDNRTITIPDADLDLTDLVSGKVDLDTAGKFILSDGDGTVSESATLSEAAGDITVADETDLVLSETTGTKIGTAATQKLGLWGAAPVGQQASANQAALTNSTGGTYDGTLVAISGTGADADLNNNFTDIFTQLDQFRSDLVAIGAIKGSA